MTNYDALKEYEAHKTPVPSYEEYNRLKEVERKKGKLVNVNYKIKQENQQLKELLYNSMVYLNCHIDNDGNVFVNGVSTSSFIKEIDNAIGEKK